MSKFSQALALMVMAGMSLIISNPPSMAQNHGGHHSSPSPSSVTPESREQSRAAEAHVNEALTKLHQKEYSAAIESFGKALEIQPDHYIAYTYRADIQLLLKNYQEAIADYTKAIEFNPAHSHLLNSRGVSYTALGEYQKAIADHTEAMRIYPEEGATYRYRGIAYYQLGEDEKALEDLNIAIAQNEKDAKAYNVRGDVQARLKNPESAIADYQQAAKLFLARSDRDGYTKALRSAKLLQQQSAPATTQSKY